jgi:thiosulfate dehydrogenase
MFLYYVASAQDNIEVPLNLLVKDNNITAPEIAKTSVLEKVNVDSKELEPIKSKPHYKYKRRYYHSKLIKKKSENLTVEEIKYFVPQPDSNIPNDQFGELVKYGKNIFTDTQHYAKRYTGNTLNCSDCHLDAGRKPNAAPLWASFGMYPAYKSKSNKVETFEEHIQQCFKYSLNGFAPALNSREIKAINAYAYYLSKGTPTGIQLPGRNFKSVAETGYDPNAQRGKIVYEKNCVTCHSENGSGKNQTGIVMYPPLWGGNSYNKGSEMFNIHTLAGFIIGNMQLNQIHLTNQDALDLAAWINLQDHPMDPRKGWLEGFLQGGAK